MKIQYCSDLHLEFAKNSSYLQGNRLIPQADTLILAGDVIPLWKDFSKEWFLDFVSENFRKVYWLPGNHEYYNWDIEKQTVLQEKKVRDNIQLVSNKVISIDGVNLIFSTLWSYISPRTELYIKSHLNDFALIRVGDEAFRPKHYNSLHQESKKFIQESLQKLKGQINVVVTHHVPTLFNHTIENSPINEAYATDLSDIIEKHQPEAWIYGHCHTNTPEFTIGRTRMVTNQFGYVERGEHETFIPDKVLVL